MVMAHLAVDNLQQRVSFSSSLFNTQIRNREMVLPQQKRCGSELLRRLSTTDSEKATCQVISQIRNTLLGLETGEWRYTQISTAQAMEDQEKGLVIEKMIDIVNEISLFSVYRGSIKQFWNLARRLKLLLPMFEELGDSKDSISEDTLIELKSLKEAMESSKKFLRLVSQGSKIYLVLEREQIVNQFQQVTATLEKALNGISYDNLKISDEVREQVDLVLAQFRRAKGQVDAVNDELYEDLLSVYIKSSDADVDLAVLGKLAEKLQLMSINDFKQESLALQEISNAGDPGESIEKMSMLLKKIKDFVLTDNRDPGAPESEKCPSSGNAQPSTDANPKYLIIPDDIHHLISGELMKDPVIVSTTTGETYDRSCIEKLFEVHLMCSKTQLKLLSAILTPRCALRDIIAQWCECAKIDILIRKLTSGGLEDQESAAGELKLAAKRTVDNRVYIAEVGAIPLLIGLLSSSDQRTQKHAVTALLNLSVCEDNERRIISSQNVKSICKDIKESIVSSGGVPAIVHVLKEGSLVARENAAALLLEFSLVNDENKVTIGALGAIPLLVTLLPEGSQRGKEDAAGTLDILCLYEGNIGRVLQVPGVVATLKRMLTEPEDGIVQAALNMLVTLVCDPEGKAAIEASPDVTNVTVEVIGNGQILVKRA